MGRRKRVERHCSTGELDAAVDAAQKSGDARLLRRLLCIRQLYEGDTLADAATRMCVDPTTVGRWVDSWNDGGVDGLRPEFGGGRPSSLSTDQREQLAVTLWNRGPWTAREVRDVIEATFGVEYSERHVARIIDDLGIETDSGRRIPDGETVESVEYQG